MFIRAEKKELLEAVTPALCAVSSKGTVAAFECLYFSAKEKEKQVTVTAFDNSKGVKTALSATVLEEGGLLLNGHKLAAFLRTLPEGEVSISSDDRFVTTISCKKSKFEIAGMSETNFPALPELHGDRSLTVPQGVLKKMLSGVIFSYLMDDSKPALTGVLFEAKEGELSLCSCDGYRISLTKAPCESDKEERFIVPGKTLVEIIKLLHDAEEETVRIELSHKHIIFVFEDLLLFSRLVEGEYIEYKASLPSVFSCTAAFRAEEALQSVERASLVIDERAKSPVVLTVSDTVIDLKSQTANGKVEEEFGAKIQGDGLTIGFNNRFLADALRGASLFGGEEVLMEIVSPIKGAVLRPAEGEAFYYMILPVKL